MDFKEKQADYIKVTDHLIAINDLMIKYADEEGKKEIAGITEEMKLIRTQLESSTTDEELEGVGNMIP